MEVLGFDLQQLTNGILTVVGTILVWVAGRRGLNYAKSGKSESEPTVSSTTIVDSVAASHMKILAGSIEAQNLQRMEENSLRRRNNDLLDRHNDQLSDITRALSDLSRELARRH